MSKIKAGVIGLGGIGKNHARIMAELAASGAVEFTAVYDANRELAAETARLYKTRAAVSLEEFATLVEAASVAAPTRFHFEIGSYLLEHGKHVLIEKPITEATDDAHKLVALAQQKHLALQVGHVERFNPVLGKLEEFLANPRFIESHRLSPYPHRSTEIGVVLDLMIHDLEIILHLVSSPLAKVQAVGVPVLSKGEDIANARLKFENGCVANITVSRISPERMRKIRVFQQDAYLSLDYQKQEGYIYRLGRDEERESSFWKKLLAAKESAIVSEFAGRKIVREPVAIEKGEPLKREIASFIECARLGAQPKVSGAQATAALELALEITQMISSQNAAK